ncbi:MAG: YqeG family HAD IIIA-type phosphatase [Planctomycetota bacterium]|nr:YqeG family HAD IIIA-type phosphatase [Planctomycetota bacterium]
MSIFSPNLAVESVLDLSRERLLELGLDTLLLDVDCTLKEYRSESVSPAIRDWLDELRAAGVGLCLVSNGRGKRIGRLAESLDMPYIAGACKPLPFGLNSAIRKMDFDRTRTAMVGDQIFADIMAARLAGIFSILVEPISPEQEPWFTRAKRPLERWLAGGRRKT